MRAFVLALLALGCTIDGIDAKPAARLWAAEMGYKTQGVSCAESDSDWDGYVSCSVNAEGQDPISIECGYSYRIGCKMSENIKNKRR
jgi:hypothetical protein